MAALRKLNVLISQHTTTWFHRVGLDDLSPERTARMVSDLFLEYLTHRKFRLAIPATTFRINICEFLCTYYIARKRGTGFNGPLSRQLRPRGWTWRHEQEWMDYLHYTSFSADFWAGFWARIPEAIWEARIPGWRDAFEYVALHYIAVRLDVLDMVVDDKGKGNLEDFTVASLPSDDEDRM